MTKRFSVLLFPMLLVTATALAGGPNPGGFVGTYTLNGTTTVDAAGYHREFHPPLEVVATKGTADGELQLKITRLGYSCTLRAVAQSDVAVTFPAGQTCPQSISGDHFTAELTGTLKSGGATLSNKTVTLVADWDVEGTVRIFGVPVPGRHTGKMHNDATGTTP